jgi:taurine dioxygenase
MPLGCDLRITPLTSALGARVEGLSLADPLDADHLQALRAAVLEHLVLVFPGQSMSAEKQHLFASAFGRPETHPVTRHLGSKETVVSIENSLIAAPDPTAPPHLDHLTRHGAWHTDYTFHREIPTFATLRAEVVPPIGGDTLWTSTVAAFDALSPRLQRWLGELSALHWHGPHFARNFGLEAMGPQAVARFERAFPPVEHPVVLTHPETARRVLFVNPSYTVRLVGVEPAESEMLLDFLFRHVTQPRFQLRHHWSPGDLVLWDERSTLHLAPTDFLPHPRRLIRVAVGSEQPSAELGPN